MPVKCAFERNRSGTRGLGETQVPSRIPRLSMNCSSIIEALDGIQQRLPICARQALHATLLDQMEKHQFQRDAARREVLVAHRLSAVE